MSHRLSPSMIVSLLALVIGLGGVGLAANNGPLLLGSNNSAPSQTALAAHVNGDTFRITNSSRHEGATALSLVVKTSNPPLTVNSNVLVANLNADFLGGLHANELMRLGTDANQNETSTLTFSAQAQVTLDIPATGFVLLTSQAQFKTQSSACDPCYAHIRFNDQTAVATSPVQIVSVGNGTTSVIDVAGSVTWVFPVTSGERIFSLETGVFPSGSIIAVENPVMTALFVPFGADGTDASSAEPAAAEMVAPKRFGPVRRDGSRAIIR